MAKNIPLDILGGLLGKQELSLKTEVAGAISKISGRLISELHELGAGSIFEVFQQFTGQNPDERIRVRIREILSGATDAAERADEHIDELRAEWIEFKARLDHKVPDSWRVLFMQLGNANDALDGDGVSQPALIDWPIFSKQLAAGSPRVAPLFAFEASADAVLGIQSIRRADWPGSVADQPKDFDAVVRFGLTGNFRVATKTGGNFKSISAKAAATVTREPELDYLFRHDSHQRFIEAIAHDMPKLVSPLNLPAVYERFESDNLHSIRLRRGGTLELSGEVKIGKSFAAGEVGLNLGVTARATQSYAGHYELRLTPRPNPDALDKPSIYVDLRRLEDDQKEGFLSIGAEIDISAAAKDALVIVDRHLGDASDLLKELNQFKQSGTKLRNKLKEELLKGAGTNSVKVMLANALVGDATADQFDNALTEALTADIDDNVDVFTEDTGQAAVRIVDQLLTRFSLPQATALSIRTRLLTTANTFLTDQQKKIKAKVRKLVTSAPGRKKIRKAIATTGDEISSFSGSVDKKLDKALMPVIRVLQRYQKVRKALREQITWATENKIKAAFYNKTIDKTGRDFKLSFWVDPDSKVAREFLANALTGDVSSLVGALQADDPWSSHGIKADSVDLVERFNWSQEKGLSISAFGIDLFKKSILDLDTEISSDELGNLKVHSTARRQDSIQAFRESRHLSFVDAYSVATAGKLEASFDIGLNLSLRDQQLKPKEIQQFVGSLEQFSLLRAGTTERVQSEFASWKSREGAKSLQSEIAVAMDLSPEQVRTLLEHKPVDQYRADVLNWYLKLDKLPITGGERDFHKMLLKQFDALRGMSLDDAMLAFQSDANKDAIATILRGERPGRGSADRSRSETVKQLMEFRGMLERGDQFAALIDMIGALYDNAPTDKETIDKAQKGILEQTKDWLNVRGIFEGFFLETVKIPTRIFLGMLAQHSGRLDLENPMTLKMAVWQNKTRVEVPLD